MPFTQEQIQSRIIKHKSEFIQKSKEIHGDKYDYDLSTYLSPHIKMKITCHKHGDFYQKPYDHTYGKGCKKCATEKLAETIRYDSSTFIEKAKKIHGDKYIYSGVDYKHNRIPIVIKCRKHGDFYQKPTIHLNGSGCKKCAINTRVGLFKSNLKEFIERARVIHEDKYDYTKTIYEHCDKKTTITCPAHGDFLISPSSHIRGSGCVECVHEKARLDNLGNLEEFIEKAKLKHNNKYNYDKSIYIDRKTKIKILCPTHGEFFQTPSVHLTGSGCKLCFIEKRTRTTEEFIEMSNEVHGSRYDYSETVYTGCFNLVKIRCRQHGEFSQQANSHIRGSGCPQCSESRGERDVAYTLDKFNIKYIKQYMVPNNPYKYDFYLPDYNIFIEFHGIQHYVRIPYFHKEDNDFTSQLIRDDVKKEIVKYHKGRLIIVRYNLKTRSQVEEFLFKQLKKLKVI